MNKIQNVTMEILIVWIYFWENKKPLRNRKGMQFKIWAATESVAVSELPGYPGRRHVQWSHYFTAEFSRAQSNKHIQLTRILHGICPGVPGHGIAYALNTTQSRGES